MAKSYNDMVRQADKYYESISEAQSRTEICFQCLFCLVYLLCQISDRKREEIIRSKSTINIWTHLKTKQEKKKNFTK